MPSTPALPSSALVALLVACATATAKNEPVPAPGLERTIRIHNDGKTTGTLPPGMVLVPGDRFTMGIDPKQLEELADAIGVGDGGMGSAMAVLVGLYPDHQIEVGDLLVDQYEFTNRQYHRYLESRHQDPSPELLDWYWFSLNQEGLKEKGYPEDKADLPVHAVSGYEADAAARAIGKRLPTEDEWEHFARRGLAPDRYYPWEAEGRGVRGWNRDNCVNSANAMTKDGLYPKPGGSIAADSNGEIFDLCGNVMEWTRSPYRAYPGWKPFEMKVRKKKTQFFAEFTGEKWVIRAGSCRGNEISNMLIFRQGLDPACPAEFVGFRAVSSATPGLDQLHYAENVELPLLKGDLGGLLDFGPEAMVGQTVMLSDGDTHDVLEAEHLTFTRIAEAPQRSETVLEKATVDEPQAVGILSTSQAMQSPKLPAGSYVLYFKGEGESKAQKEALKAKEEAEKEAKKNGDKKDEGADEKDKGRNRKGNAPNKSEAKPEDQGDEQEKEDAAEAEGEQEEAAAEKPAEEKVAGQIDILDVPTDIDVLLVKSQAGDLVAWLPVTRGTENLHPTRFGYVRGGATVERTIEASVRGKDEKVPAPTPNDVATFQFSLKTGSGIRFPEMTFAVEFAPGAFEPVTMPAAPEPDKGRRSGRK